MGEWINDYLILGKACPDRSRKYGHAICTAGYSFERNEFIRLFPMWIQLSWKIRRWNIIRVPIESKISDYRSESYAVRDRNSRDELREKIQLVSRYKDGITFIRSHYGPCINELNNQKRSLGIVKVKEIKKCYFKEREKYTSLVPRDLLGNAIVTKRNYPYVPRIVWRGEKCTVKSFHDTQILDWGAYEFMRKTGKDLERLKQLWLNYRLNIENREIYFFLGNVAYRPTSFMVISIYSLPKEN